MLGAESRLESRLNTLELLMRNPESVLNLATLLVSEKKHTHTPKGHSGKRCERHFLLTSLMAAG